MTIFEVNDTNIIIVPQKTLWENNAVHDPFKCGQHVKKKLTIIDFHESHKQFKCIFTYYGTLWNLLWTLF